MKILDGKHFYKVSGDLIYKISQIVEDVYNNEHILFVHLGELAEIIKHERFDEVDNNG